MTSPPEARVVVIGNEKGGSGKSTTAMHLIVALLRLGHGVASIDLDRRQRTLSRYIENRRAYAARHRRELPLPDHRDLDSGDEEELRALVDRLRPSFRAIVIDTPEIGRASCRERV